MAIGYAMILVVQLNVCKIINYYTIFPGFLNVIQSQVNGIENFKRFGL